MREIFNAENLLTKLGMSKSEMIINTKLIDKFVHKYIQVEDKYEIFLPYFEKKYLNEY